MYYAYVGSRTTRERNACGEGISVYRIDPLTAELSLVQLLGNLINPSYLALSHCQQYLYAVHGDQSDLSAFAIDAGSGALRWLNTQSTGGRNPVHLAIAPDNQFIVVSNHLGSSLAVVPILEDGRVGALEQLLTLEGPIGPHRVEQKQSKPHANPFSPSGDYVLVPDKGLDRIFCFRFQGGRLHEATFDCVPSREGAGPRHLAFHPRLPFAYVVNELDSTVTTYHWHESTGQLMPLQILSCLPDVFTGNSRGAAIQVSADGRFVFASNRGADSIARFRVNPDNGLLQFLGTNASMGRTPRHFSLSPDGGHAYVLNEEGNSIVTFAINQDDAQLTPTGGRILCGSPVCMVIKA